MDGWISVSLGDAFQTITGSTPPKSNKENYGTHIPFVKPPELNDCEVYDASDNLSEAGAELARVLPEKSILVSCIGNLGKIGINTKPVAFNQQINAIVPGDTAVPEFMFYQTLSPQFQDMLTSLAAGTTVSIVNKSKFNSIPIVLPPLPEQQRIIAILDKAFEGIDAAVANTEQNLANARELFESYLNNVFTEKGKGWVEKKLGEVFQIKPPKKEAKQKLA